MAKRQFLGRRKPKMTWIYIFVFRSFFRSEEAYESALTWICFIIIKPKSFFIFKSISLTCIFQKYLFILSFAVCVKILFIQKIPFGIAYFYSKPGGGVAVQVSNVDNICVMNLKTISFKFYSKVILFYHIFNKKHKKWL